MRKLGLTPEHWLYKLTIESLFAIDFSDLNYKLSVVEPQHGWVPVKMMMSYLLPQANKDGDHFILCPWPLSSVHSAAPYSDHWCSSFGKWPPCRRGSQSKVMGSWTVTSVITSFYLMTNTNNTCPSLISTVIHGIRHQNDWPNWNISHDWFL